MAKHHSSFQLRRGLTPTAFDLITLAGYSGWLATEISRLSSPTQDPTSIICVACGKALGTYIFEDEENTFRPPKEEALAFLTFIVAQGAVPIAR